MRNEKILCGEYDRQSLALLEMLGNTRIWFPGWQFELNIGRVLSFATWSDFSTLKRNNSLKLRTSTTLLSSCKLDEWWITVAIAMFRWYSIEISFCIENPNRIWIWILFKILQMWGKGTETRLFHEHTKVSICIYIFLRATST